MVGTGVELGVEILKLDNNNLLVHRRSVTVGNSLQYIGHSVPDKYNRMNCRVKEINQLSLER